MPPRAPKVAKGKANSTFFQTGKRKAKKSPVKTKRRKRRQKKGDEIPSSWKLMSDSAKSFILRLFDDGIRLLMLKVPQKSSEKVHRVLIDARNRVAVNLETLKVPPGSHDYSSDGSTLVKLRKTKKQLDRRLKSLEESVDLQSKELEKLESERDQLLEFKSAGKHHPLFTENFENELHLTFDIMK